ncbi:hypothetical protein TNCV_3183981 [Trichonephila clavipes]|nr:hypothetical protein TNCV_3183981 [Trichonephila clavipes]
MRKSKSHTEVQTRETKLNKMELYWLVALTVEGRECLLLFKMINFSREKPFIIVLTLRWDTFTHAENSDMQYMYDCGNGNAITRSFQIDECQITEIFSGYIVNFVKRVRSTSPDMMLVNEKLYLV